MSGSASRPIHIAIVLSPLLPALVLPGVGVLISLTIVIVALLAVRQSRRPTLALISQSVLRSLAIGLAGGVLVGFGMLFVIDPLLELATGATIDLSDFDGVRGEARNFALLLAVGLLFGGIIEEVIFRGFVVGWGQHLMGPGSGPLLVAVSAFVFGAAHHYQGTAGMLSTGITGALLGLIYLQSGSRLLPAIVAHMTINTIGITAIYFGWG